MKEQWNENAEYLNEQQVRDIVNVLDMFIENTGAVHHGRVGVHVHQEKNAERYDARKLVQFAQQKGLA
jgi:N-glycosylase/DNA lyase